MTEPTKRKRRTAAEMREQIRRANRRYEEKWREKRAAAKREKRRLEKMAEGAP